MNAFDRSILRQLFIDALPDYAIVLLDVDGNVLSWNAGGRTLLGYGADEIVGRHFSCLYPQDQVAARVAAALDDARALDRHQETGRLVAKDGAEVEALSVFMPLHDRHKTLLGFGILIRGVDGPKPTGAANPRQAVVGQGHEQILVVDDDEEILKIALRQLASLGYRVTGASSGAEALEILARVADVDLLFTDVSMPAGMGGRELAERAVHLRPGLKVLFASGYFEGALVGEGDVPENAQFLVKPYRKKDLASKVRDALSGAAS